MTEMVNGELRLNPISRQGVRLDRHHASIVNQIIDLVHEAIDLRRGAVDRLETVEIHGDKDRGDLGVDLVDLIEDRLHLGGVAGEQDQFCGVAAGEGRCGFGSKTL